MKVNYHSRRWPHRLRTLAVMTLVMVLFASGFTSGSAPTGPSEVVDGPNLGPIPVLTLSLTPHQLQAAVTESELGAVTFEGTATVDQMRIMTSTVTLTAVVSTGWPVVLSDQTIEFSGPGEESFQVTVIVPPGTSAMLTGAVRVDGSCKVPGLAPVVAACSAVVTVSPYYRGRITAPDGIVQVDGGEKQTIELTVYNDGNAYANMRIYVAQKPKDVQVSFSTTEFDLQQDESIYINVTIGAVSGADPGNYLMGLVVEADTQAGGTEKISTFNLSVYIPSLKAKLGTSGMMAIVVVIGAVGAVVVLWKMGKFSELKWFKRTKESVGKEEDTVLTPE